MRLFLGREFRCLVFDVIAHLCSLNMWSVVTLLRSSVVSVALTFNASLNEHAPSEQILFPGSMLFQSWFFVAQKRTSVQSHGEDSVFILACESSVMNSVHLRQLHECIDLSTITIDSQVSVSCVFWRFFPCSRSKSI